ncbi:YceK/YidQ family lipoprotein [Bibersteinia trehalosi]|uniref:Lipoprotein n=2 Tax=Bibersteinia trehalosi TaxID=47735 RepID=W0R3Y0_BIBTR|nr:YceK/YidQ family lipoprotein [Bibersteinia trehalosi]AHG85451.1 hypothetical protein F544_2170 [Bibersteinia trehalosi USDA-ARS-USMARC-190]RRN05784.1 YceK/YidQ family lipoprotein [Bibersteinia trehalosi]
MKKWLKLLLLIPLLTGCSTLLTLDSKEFYSGTKQNIEVWEPCHGSGCMGLVILRPLSIIDFPFSLVGDTLMLPIKGIQNLAD